MMITVLMSEHLRKITLRVPQLDDWVNSGCNTDEQIANRLISLYRETDDLEVRQNIMAFMTDAGYVWLRKLFTHDDSFDQAAA